MCMGIKNNRIGGDFMAASILVIEDDKETAA